MSSTEIDEKTAHEEFLNCVCIDVVHDVPKAASIFPPRAVVSRVLWSPYDKITYAFLDGPFEGTPIQQQKVNDIIGEWMRYIGVKLVQISAQGDFRPMIRISFNPASGSWSYVGSDAIRVPSDNATMNFNWIDKGSAMTEGDRSVILHEFGHALGYRHEHQSPIRGTKLTLKEDVIIKRYTSPPINWTEASTRANIINVHNRNNLENFSEVDLTSIMMYSMPASFNEEGIAIKANRVLSDLDRAYMAINYPRDEPDSDPVASQWTAEHALTVAGVPAATKKIILDFWRKGLYSKVRDTFSIWNSAMQSLNNPPANKDEDTTISDIKLVLDIYNDVLSPVTVGAE